jgi:hypothetical protein
MKYLYIGSVFITLAMLPGCSRISNWAQSQFYQGDQVDIHISNIQQQVRSVYMYDQFATDAIFDALWLSNEVRTTYSNIYNSRHGKDGSTFLRRQLEENKHYISFYVLSSYDTPLGAENCLWTLLLHINDQIFTPKEVKMVELPQEYQLFFGKRFNRFKVAYLVKFDALDVEEQPLVTEQVDEIKLVLRSIKKETTVAWHVRTIPDEHNEQEAAV